MSKPTYVYMIVSSESGPLGMYYDPFKAQTAFDLVPENMARAFGSEAWTALFCYIVHPTGELTQVCELGRK